MTKRTKSWLISAAFTLSTIVALGLIDIPGVAAAPTKEEKPSSLIDKLIFFFKGGQKKDLPRVSATGRRTKIAGSRDICKVNIVALIPDSNLGVTTSSNPIFWFYISHDSVNVESLRFSLLNREQKEIWATDLSVTSKKIKSGLLKVPYQGQPLMDGAYQWQFSYKETRCDPILLSGKVQKESHPHLGLGNNARERLRIYAQNGIWYELLTELITLRQEQPQDTQLAADFRSLIFESEHIKYFQSTDPSKEDRDLMEKIVKAKVIK